MTNQLQKTNEAQGSSILKTMADRFGMAPLAFQQVIKQTCLPAGKEVSQEQFAAFLLVANEYKLNPLTKEIYAFPAKGGGIIPIVGVDGWSNLINSHPQFDGMDFKDEMDSEGKLISVTCRMHRKDRAHPIEATEYMSECNRASEDKYNAWNKWPRRMLRHKAMIQAARYSFGFAGIYDPDEGERIAEASPPVQIVKLEEIPSAPSAPEPVDPEKILKDIETDLAPCSDLESVDDTWRIYQDKVMQLLPSDQKAAHEIYEKNQLRFESQEA